MRKKIFRHANFTKIRHHTKEKELGWGAQVIEQLFMDLTRKFPEDKGYLEFAISTRIYDLMTQKGLSKAEFARAVGKRPCEITKWLSGQHNFTLATLAMLSSFFGQPIITVG